MKRRKYGAFKVLITGLVFVVLIATVIVSLLPGEANSAWRMLNSLIWGFVVGRAALLIGYKRGWI